MALLGEIKINGKRIDLHHFTGEVVGNSTWSETHLSARGGGSNYGGAGYHSNSGISVRSETTRNDQFFLKDNDGQEKAFEFKDLGIACRQGHILSVLWGVPRKKRSGVYWFVYNHNTKDAYPFTALRKLFRPSKLSIFIVLIFGFILSAALSSPLLAGPSLVLWLFIPFTLLVVYMLYFYIVRGRSSYRDFCESNSKECILSSLRSAVSQEPCAQEGSKHGTVIPAPKTQAGILARIAVLLVVLFLVASMVGPIILLVLRGFGVISGL